MNRGITELPKINGSKSKSSLTSNSPNKTGDHPRPRPVAHATIEGSNNTIVWNIIEEKMAYFRHENKSGVLSKSCDKCQNTAGPM